MDHFPGMQDPAIIAVVVVALLAGAFGAAIWITGRRLDRAMIFYPEQDLKHFSITARHRPAWLAGILAALVLVGLTSWLAQRDDDALARFAYADKRLDQILAVTRCAPPDAPLEKVVISIGSQADGGPPTVACVYITSAFGTVPKLRYERPMVARGEQ